MQFSESWLRTLVNPSLTSEELSHLLTMAGLEVEEMKSVAAVFDNVVVAQVLSKDKHPDADRLNVLTVDVGQAEPLTIVCGAGNVTVGMKAPCALVGAKLPGIEIKQAKVRGIASFGMMCSEKELGLAADSEGLMVLDVAATVGQSIREHLDLDDHLITLKLTPNRCDCLSLNGIAREVAALTGASMNALPVAIFNEAGAQTKHVKVGAVSACPRYSGRVIAGVNAKAQTPDWMVKRLQRCGLHSISALVDVTNYVLLEMGQPLHAFDSNKLHGDIEVRFARAGEKLTLLNEQVLDLAEDMLVIADAHNPVALAGVMGGAESAVGEETVDVFLESAFFSPSVIVGKSRRLGFSSDSAYRFERGVDFANTRIALDRATQLIIDICGGTASKVSEVLSALPSRSPVKLRTSRVLRILGVSIESNDIAQILTRLGMVFQREGDIFFVTPPSYRFDIQIEEDLVEEVARVYGYEKIQPVATQAKMNILPRVEAQRPLGKLRQTMVLRDYQEVINYAFVESAWERDLCGNANPIALKNPIASQMSVMRSSLLGGLLASLRTNLARKQPRVRLFEVGGCFAHQDAEYVQEERLAGLAYGSVQAEQWGVPSRNIDFYDVKGDVEALFAPRILSFQAQPHTASHPGRSADIVLNGRVVGCIGELHPQWQQQYDLPLAPVWFEIELTALMQASVPKVTEISRVPPVRRDIAVLIGEDVAAEALLLAMRGVKIPYVVAIELFDLYRGKGVEQGKKSLAFRVLLQDTQKTLAEADIEPSLQKLVDILEKSGAQLRS
ncbi:MAG: phenylalanine--tRNA ligase subunit beta [Sideroxydans sp.]|nr:phenylalanine--tRNA ligase subunit beta [Sideroxydans sp.]